MEEKITLELNPVQEEEHKFKNIKIVSILPLLA